MSKSWRRRRAEAFQELDGEGMDALAKGLEAVAAGDPLPAETRDYLAERTAIKEANPKPGNGRGNGGQGQGGT